MILSNRHLATISIVATTNSARACFHDVFRIATRGNIVASTMFPRWLKGKTLVEICVSDICCHYIVVSFIVVPSQWLLFFASSEGHQGKDSVMLQCNAASYYNIEIDELPSENATKLQRNCPMSAYSWWEEEDTAWYSAYKFSGPLLFGRVSPLNSKFQSSENSNLSIYKYFVRSP